ncbi:MAG: GYD domain-containing protein [Terriglobia bacterium]
MPKYLCLASYTAEGLKGLAKDKGSGRRTAVNKAVESIGGKVEVFYYALGNHDVILILDAPDNASGAALSVAVGASGLARVHTIPLLTVEEMDKGLAKTVSYHPPGH